MPRRPTSALALITSLLAAAAGCDGKSSDACLAPKPAAAAPPVREAAEDRNLRVLVAQVGAARTCRELDQMFVGLEHEDRYVGSLWVERCDVDYQGTELTLRGGGRGWRWAADKKSKAGAEFELDDNVRFEISARVTGTVDVAYRPGKRVVTAWLTATERGAELSVIGDVDVEADGVWSSVVGFVGKVVSKSPEESGADAVKSRGRDRLLEMFDAGITVSVDLCVGDTDVAFGHLEAGEMKTPPGDEEPLDDRARIHPGGLVVLGPRDLAKGITLRVEPTGGSARAELVCIDDARSVARAFLDGDELPSIEPLAGGVVDRRRDFKADKPRCDEGAVLLRSVAGAEAPVDLRFDVIGPGTHDAPILDCKALDKKR